MAPDGASAIDKDQEPKLENPNPEIPDSNDVNKKHKVLDVFPKRFMEMFIANKRDDMIYEGKLLLKR
ncbi:uncharacterized protein N0V89_003866 [Didymosphaeria variabile]|uniref:Uncharacterized protein n=1 Tax=Didymosphaeria variabile TaxID=1932322 RepID=A0A9W8XNE9_9PLEO|nr:uncharacterized protein N0V89_003866 [Didymosphaeria variabile]KAJ4355845.1 hypothetical protein N0V89_003866 [Didymosphaeria variabile]